MSILAIVSAGLGIAAYALGMFVYILACELQHVVDKKGTRANYPLICAKSLVWPLFVLYFFLTRK